METRVGSDDGWNLFAVELQAILRAHGVKELSLLDDRAGIHPEKARRLRRSLETPKSFPVLNPTEMQAVMVAFKLTEDDALRLRAAMLATAVERLLMDRIQPRDARAAAGQILPAIVEALRAYSGAATGIGAFTRKSDMLVMELMGEDTDESAQMDEALAAALDRLDSATLALSLSLYADAKAERIERAQTACEEYQAALRELAEVDEEIQRTAAWRMWHEEAERGYRQASERVEDLGG